MKLFQYILCIAALTANFPAFGQKIERANANGSYSAFCDTPALLREYVALVEDGAEPVDVAEAVSKKAKRRFACIVDHIAYFAEDEEHGRIVTKNAVYSIRKIVVVGVARAGNYIRVPMRGGYGVVLVPATKS